MYPQDGGGGGENRHEDTYELQRPFILGDLARLLNACSVSKKVSKGKQISGECYKVNTNGIKNEYKRGSWKTNALPELIYMHARFLDTLDTATSTG